MSPRSWRLISRFSPTTAAVAVTAETPCLTTAEREVEDIQVLIDESGGTAFVFGHSSGAALALEAARLLDTKITKLALYEPPFIVDDCRPAARPDWLEQTKALLAAGRPGDALELFQIQVGMPAEMVKQFRQSPMWPPLEAMAPTLVYDLTILAGTQAGSPLPLGKWAGVTVPTLVMDGTKMLGSEEGHLWMQHAADEIARVLPTRSAGRCRVKITGRMSMCWLPH